MSLTGGPLGAQTSYMGREAELDRLASRLNDARAGDGGVVIVRGPGGMGATRTAHEVAARADRAGMLVLWGRCREGSTDRPFGAVAEALEEYGAGLEPAELAAQLSSGAPVVTRLAPRLRLSLNTLMPPAPLDGPSERMRLHLAVRGWLARAADAQPMLIVLDDFQWADGDALLLLADLARLVARMPVLVLANEVELPRLPEEAPPDPHEAGLRQALADEAVAEVIQLQGLDKAATAAILASLAGEPIGGATVQLVQQVSGGEPLWARELYRHLLEEDRLEGSARGLPSPTEMPETLEQLMAWRMSRLSPEVRAALTALAAFAGGAEPGLLAQVAGLSRGRLAEYLDVGVDAGLCRVSSGGHLYVISHDRLRLALLAGISAAQRAQLHRRAAEALETELGGQGREGAGRLLHHYHLSAVLEGSERGLRHGLLAAEQARAAYALLRQVRCLERSRLLVVGGAPELVGELQVRLAAAQAEAGLFEATLASLSSALTAHRRLNRRMSDMLEQLITCLRTLRGDGLAGERQSALEALRREGLEHSARATPMTRARLELLAEHWQPFEQGPIRALTWVAQPASAVAPLAEAGTEADLAELLLVQRPRNRDESARAATHARRWRAPAAVLRALRAVSFDLLTRHGLITEAAAWAELYASTAERYAAPRDRLLGRLWLSRAQAMLGLFGGADEGLVAARAALTELPEDAWLGNELLLTELTLAHYHDGDWPALRQRIEAARAEATPHGLVLAAEQCLAAARAGLEEEARDLLPAVLDACAGLPPLSLYRDAALLTALAAAWELGAAEHAKAGRQLLEGAAVAGLGGQPAGTLRLAQARLLGLAGDVDEAVALLADERPALQAGGLRPMLALADYDEALILAAAGGRRLTEAPPLLDRAAQQFEVLGMTGWLARVHRLLESGLEAALLPGGRLHFTYPLGLSRREADVVRLIVGGASTDAAAQSLDIDPAAANRHLESALEKLGVGLEELPRAARLHGLCRG